MKNLQDVDGCVRRKWSTINLFLYGIGIGIGSVY